MLCEISFLIMSPPTIPASKARRRKAMFCVDTTSAPLGPFLSPPPHDHCSWTSEKQDQTVSVWFISPSLNMMFWRFNQSLLEQCLFFGLSSPILWIHHPALLNHSSDNEYLFYVQGFLFYVHIMKRIAIYITVHIFLWTCVFIPFAKYPEVERLAWEAFVCGIL